MRVKIIAASVLIACTVLGMSAHAQVEWEFMGGPLSASVGSATSAPDGTWYVVSYMYASESYYQLYKSTNDGATWEGCNNDTERILSSIVKAGDGALIAGSSRSVLRSVDEGLTWSSTPIYFIIPELFKGRSGAIFAIGDYTTYCGMYSVDNGVTWDTIPNPAGVTTWSTSQMAENSNNRLFVVMGNYSLYWTDNYGVSWNIINGNFSTPLEHIFVSNSDELTIFTNDSIAISSDNGLTWSYTGICPSSVSQYTMDSKGVLFGYTTENDVFMSTDHGGTWESVYHVPYEGNAIRRIHCDDNDRLLIETDMGLYTGGEGIAALDTTFLASGIPVPPRKIEVLENGFVYVTTENNGVYRTKSDGSQWDLLYKYNRNSFDTPCSSHVLAQNGDVIRFINDETKRSSDNGLTWFDNNVQDTLFIMNTLVDKQGTFFAQSGQLNLGYTELRSVYYSTNEGDNWNALFAPDSSLALSGIDDSGNVYVRTLDVVPLVAYSSDRGTTWLEASYMSTGTLYVARNGELYVWEKSSNGLLTYSTNKGHTWNPILFPPSETLLGIAVDLNGGIYTIHNSEAPYSKPRAMYTNDHGNMWVNISTGLTETDAELLSITMGEYLYIGTTRGLYRSKEPLVTSVVEPQPATVSVSGTYPNPVTAGQSAQLTYALDTAGDVEISLYTMLGTKVQTIFAGWQTKGVYSVGVSTSGLAAGMYQYVVKSQGKAQTGKMIVR